MTKDLLEYATRNLPGALILLGIIVAVFIWLPFKISGERFTLNPPRQLRYRLLVFVMGLLILASGVYLFTQGFKKSTLSQPTLRSYFTYISLEPMKKPTDSANCHITYHVALRFEVPEGEQAIYRDRIKSGGGGTNLISVPSYTVLNPNQWPGNPTLLEFSIQPKQIQDRSLDIEAVATLDTKVTLERAKIGPHLPYRTEYVVVIVDYSRMGFKTAPSLIRGEVETLEQGGVSQTGTLAPVTHSWQNGTVTLVGRNLPAESHILLVWGNK
jgi:hypothetical protein